MASSTILCLLCKNEEREETPFMALAPDCLCCNETKRIHIRCAILYSKLHTSQINKYCPDYTMCCKCTKNMATQQSYTVKSDKITVASPYCSQNQGWEEERSGIMYSLNFALKYTNPNMTSINEVWYFPLGLEYTKPLLMNKCETDRYDNRYGPFTQYYTNGKIQRLGNLVNGSKNGEWKEYTFRGQLVSVTNYSNGQFHGEYILYDESGFILKKLNYNQDKLDGHCITWYNKDQKNLDWHYIDGGLTNINKNSYCWYEDGKIYKQYIATDEKDKNGKNIIRRSEYYSNGNIKFDYKCIFNTDFHFNLEPIEYPYIEYDSNGKIEIQHTFIKKDKIKVETFFSTGNKKEIYYINNKGVKHGLYASWYSNGCREILCSYKNGNYIDEFGKWEANGTLQKFGKYENDGKFRHIDINVL